MEIERKWLVNGWPEGLPLLYEQSMRQGYISVEPTVRIREEKRTGEKAEYILCFKSRGTLARQEVETAVSEETFRQLEELIGLPLIPKIRRTYALPDGLKLEVSVVDQGAPDMFWYAEVEYGTEEEALAWQAPGREIAAYLNREVTGVPGQSMGAYWERTRSARI